jgi:DNA repair exonuclease SbcCD nuclease subunit
MKVWQTSGEYIMQILHISDTHLGARKYNLDSREEDIYETFTQLIDYAIKEHVDAIIHTGDLFDTYHPQMSAMKVAIDNLKRIQGKIPFISIAGDHDTPKRRGAIYPQRILAESLNLLVFLTGDEKGYEINKDNIRLRIYGIKHIPTVARETLLKKLSSIKPEGDRNILMLHQGLRSKLPYEGAWQLEEGELPKGFNYYAFGHFHSRFIENLGDGKLGIAGSPEIIRDDEIEAWEKDGKGGYLIDLSKKEIEIQKINTDIRPQKIVTINTKNLDNEINNLIRIFSKCKKKPILHIILEGEAVSKSLLFKKLSILENVTEFYRIAKDNTTYGEEKNVELPKDSTISQIIMTYLKNLGYTEEESKLILEIINNYDSDDIYTIIKKFAGVE